MPQIFSSVSSKLAQIPKRIIYIAGLIALVAIVATITAILLTNLAPSPSPILPISPALPSDASNNDDPLADDKTPAFINLQSTIDKWKRNVMTDIGLVIYDLDNHRVAAEYQPNKIFDVASIL